MDYFSNRKKILLPPSLRKGDKIAILSPASEIKEEYINGAVSKIFERGYKPVVMAHTVGHEKGSYSSELTSRLSDLKQAIEDPDIKAILCGRGGYGCVHLLAYLSPEIILKNPKWMIGYSDVSALHALWNHAGVASIHGPMAKHLAIEVPEDQCSEALFDILENDGSFEYLVPSTPLNNCGKAKGVLRGGNFAVLNGLADTPFDLLKIKEDEDVILFLEDISEAIYAVERMMYRLYYAGTLNRMKGLIIGQFTQYKSDKNFDTMEEMIHSLFKKLKIDKVPVVYNFPVGHVSLNFPLVEGVEVELEASPGQVCLRSV